MAFMASHGPSGRKPALEVNLRQSFAAKTEFSPPCLRCLYRRTAPGGRTCGVCNTPYTKEQLDGWALTVPEILAEADFHRRDGLSNAKNGYGTVARGSLKKSDELYAAAIKLAREKVMSDEAVALISSKIGSWSYADVVGDPSEPTDVPDNRPAPKGILGWLLPARARAFFRIRR